LFNALAIANDRLSDLFRYPRRWDKLTDPDLAAG
jgi:hypothetical protein